MAQKADELPNGETIALPQEQVQRAANIDILGCRGKMRAIIPLQGLLTVGVWAWGYTPDLKTRRVVEFLHIFNEHMHEYIF